MRGDRHEFGAWPEEELAEADRALASLKAMRDRAARELAKPAEFFEPNYRLDAESRKTKTRKIKYLQQTAVLHCLLLRHELALKNLSIVDGYILTVDGKSPLLTYLSARYALELLATINFLVDELKAAKAIDLRDWEGRGRRFVSALCRGRYAASDPAMATLLKGFGVSKSAIEPIKIMVAINKLGATEFFSSATRDYDFLSNICHHNGSSHQLFLQSMRETVSVRLPSGDRAVVTSPGVAVTLEYPPRVACRSSFVQTASLVLSCAAWVETILGEMPIVPFSDEDMSTLTQKAKFGIPWTIPY
jgi:hypothetical protein